MTRKITEVSFYLQYGETPEIKSVQIAWDEINMYYYDDVSETMLENPSFQDRDPMRHYYVEKYERIPKWEREEYGGLTHMDGYRLGRSTGWGLVGGSDRDNYSFVFKSLRAAKEARAQLLSLGFELV